MNFEILSMLNLLRSLILTLVTFHERAGNRRIWRAKGLGPGLSTTVLPTDVTVFWLPSIVKGLNNYFRKNCSQFQKILEFFLSLFISDMTRTKFWRSRLLPEHRVLTVQNLTNKFRVIIFLKNEKQNRDVQVPIA